MPLAQPFNWSDIINRRQREVDRNNLHENASRCGHDYQVGDRIWILDRDPMRGKLAPRVLDEGPWPVIKPHTNGTITIWRNSYLERINIRRVKPAK